MNRLVEADQTGSGIDPLRIANELGQIRQLLAEDAEVPREPVFERPAALAVEEDREPHRGRGEGMRRAADALFAEPLLQDPRHEREETSAADDVKPGDLAPRDRILAAGS